MTPHRPNPYLTQAGFGLRVQYAKKRLERYGRDPGDRPCCRAFDNCFEMFDGNAVVFALVQDALNGNEDLRRGIERTGEKVWPEWLRVYEHGALQTISQAALDL